jgi:hypothetical protein
MQSYRNPNDDLQAKIIRFLESISKIESEKQSRPVSKYHYFISYTGVDRPTAERLYNDLSNRQLEVWYDENEILPGDSIVEKIEQGLKKSDRGVILFSSRLADRVIAQHEREAMLALMARKEFTAYIPILLDLDFDDFAKEYPLASTRKVLSIKNDSWDKIINQLIRVTQRPSSSKP